MNIVKQPWFIDEVKRRFPIEGGKPIAEDHNISVGRVYDLAKRLEVKSPQTQHRERNVKSLKVNYFKDWTFEMSYAVGYIWADGNLRKNLSALKLECSKTDDEIIIGIRDRLGSQHNLCYYQPEISKELSYIVISSREIVKDLVNIHGILPRKSYLSCPFPKVPDQYLASFLRGYFDGDGCISPPTAYFAGELQFLTGMRDRIIELTDLPKPDIKYHEKGSELRQFRWSSLENLTKLYQFLYSDNGPRLKRKEQIFQVHLKSGE